MLCNCDESLLNSTFQLKVLLLMHGWPGSFVEYLEVIKRFTNPVKYGANESEAFAVVCPSIPGFGFSDAPQKKGLTSMCVEATSYGITISSNGCL